MMAPCPVCLDHFGERNLVTFDSPEAGWPTHCSKEHYEQDDQHHLYAPRLREANEDEHDLRSGRLLAEFENLPGKYGTRQGCAWEFETWTRCGLGKWS